ncbi:MAG: tetratricopeptide repeat protein [Pyrinomonadaceae bacterium]
MLERNARGLGLSVVLLSLFFVVRVAGQGIPPGSASTDTGYGGINTISGMIISSNGQRIQRRVSIRLRSMTQGDRISTTDDNGNFAFRGLPSGDFAVVIDKEQDFEPFSQNVSIIQPRGMPPQTYYLSIRLSLKERSESRTGVLNAEFADVPRPALAFYQKALALAQGGKTKPAIEQLNLAIAEYPGFMLAFNELGVQYLKLGDLEKANNSLQSALKIAPQAFEPLMNHGITLVRLNRFAEAEPELRAAIKQKDQSPIGHFYLGRALAYTQRYDEGEKELNTALKLGGDEMKEAHRYLAGIYNAQGDKPRAIIELETYLKLAPNSKDAEHLQQVIRDLRAK